MIGYEGVPGYLYFKVYWWLTIVHAHSYIMILCMVNIVHGVYRPYTGRKKP